MDAKQGPFLDMSWLKVPNLIVCVVIFVAQLGDAAMLIHWERAPPLRTRFSTAVFEYDIVDPDGNQQCVDSGCAVLCELDGEPLKPCPLGLVRFRNLARNRGHSFHVHVTNSNGERNSASYNWYIDTIAPTATLAMERNFTNADSVTFEVLYSEPCAGKGGFRCSNASNCSVIINGPATIDLSAVQEIEPNIRYRLSMDFSMGHLYGRVVVRMADEFCTDEAGNPFTRSNGSVAIIHFDRRPVNVDLWTSVPSYELDIGRVPRTILATNKLEDLKIFLDFSDPVLNSTEDMLAALQVNVGQLSPIHNGSHANRRFAFELKNVSDTQILTVRLASSALVGRSGAYISPAKPVVFLYDCTKPGVRLSTGSPEVTKDPRIHVIIEFTKPVFGFDSSAIAIEGGRVARFEELSKALYSLTVLAEPEDEVSIVVPEGKVTDIAGNRNLASNQLEVRHYSTPAISVALHSFVTAGILATSFTAGVLAFSAANLAAVGDLTTVPLNIVFADPSRNLLGMVGHMQTFVFSEWLSTSLPVEYSETTKGLQWLIPRTELPWKEDSPLWTDNAPTYDRSTITSQMREGILASGFSSNCSSPFQMQTSLRSDTVELPDLPKDLGNQQGDSGKYPSLHQNPCRSEFGEPHKKHNVSMKDVPYGSPLESIEYFVYFLRGEPLSAANVVKKMEHYTGWMDFEMNMFWLALGGGGLVVIHILALVFLRWRTGTRTHGILLIPRFELFLLVLVLPCICQSSGFLIRGSTTGGIITGALLLAVPAAFFLSIGLFLTVAISTRGFVHYKELKQPDGKISWHLKLIILLLGRSVKGKWFYWDGTPSSFLPRFGILFEDRRGPRMFVRTGENDPSHIPEWTESGQNGIGRMRVINSDDGNGESAIPSHEILLGCARSAYILMDLLRRAGFGIIAGAYPSRENTNNQNQWFVALGITVLQLLYLLIIKPYIRRGVQLVESMSLACETGIFGLAVYIDQLDKYNNQRTIGIVMLSLMFTSFACQLVNEWYAMIRCLLQISESQKPSLRLGLKWVLKGTILPLLPKRHWASFLQCSDQPKTGLAPVAPPNTDSELEARNPGRTATVVPVYSPESPAFTVPRLTAPSFLQTGEGSRAGPLTRSVSISNQRSWMRMAEEKRPKGLKLQPRDDMKKLQKLAMASFARNKKSGEGSSSHAGRDQVCSDESFSGTE